LFSFSLCIIFFFHSLKWFPFPSLFGDFKIPFFPFMDLFPPSYGAILCCFFQKAGRAARRLLCFPTAWVQPSRPLIPNRFPLSPLFPPFFGVVLDHVGNWFAPAFPLIGFEVFLFVATKLPIDYSLCLMQMSAPCQL